MIVRRAAAVILASSLIGLVSFALTGCVTERPKPPEAAKLVWPPPPGTARIQFVRSVVGDEDIAHDTTYTQGIINFLSGVKPPPNRIIEPMGLAVSDDGQTLYVADTAWQQVFVFDFGRKKFSKIEGFKHPLGVALDGSQNLYVVDQEMKGIKVFNSAGQELRFITDKSVARPVGVAIDRHRGKIYLVDTALKNNEEHDVKVFAIDGKLLGHFGGPGITPGKLLYPTYVALDDQGDVYVTDTINCRVEMFDAGGKFVKMFGQAGDAWGMFARPKGLAVDTLGNLYVADSGWSNIQIFNQKGQVLLFFGGRGPIPGMLANPTAVAIDKTNHIFVGDLINHRVEEYQLVNTVHADTQSGPMTTASK